MDTQAEIMIDTMEHSNFKLKDKKIKINEKLKVDLVDVSKPLQELFDECLSFISVTDLDI